jgi:hypothetical protein
MSKRKVKRERRYQICLTLSPETLERLRCVGSTVAGGNARVVEDCLRMCLPLYQSRELENGISVDTTIQSDMILSMLIPEIFGRAIAVAFRETMQKENENLSQGM